MHIFNFLKMCKRKEQMGQIDRQLIEAFATKGFERDFYGFGMEFDWEHHVEIPCAVYVKKEEERELILHFSVLNHFQSKEYREKKAGRVRDCSMLAYVGNKFIDAKIPEDLKGLCNLQIARLIEIQNRLIDAMND